MQTQAPAPNYTSVYSTNGVDRPAQGLTAIRSNLLVEEDPPVDKGTNIPTPHVGVLPPQTKTKRATDETSEMEELRLRRESEETKRRMKICSDC